ncbi:MAG: M28 family peptidase [Flavobacterium sp.]|nr:M28 family peptidase [Candidatus Neoflavobacterium equi]
MIKIYALLSSLLLPMAAAAQTYNNNIAQVVAEVNQTRMTENLQAFENLGVKSKGTAAQENTYQWLVAKYTSFGYGANAISTQTYSYSNTSSKNLIVDKIGALYPDEFVIVCGHFDTVVGTGTNDNGSGVTTILEIAKAIKNIPTAYSVKFINFSGEEDGLYGSSAFVNQVVNGTQPKMKIRLVLNIDEVGGVKNMSNTKVKCERDLSSPTANNARSNEFTLELMNCVRLYSSLTPELSNAYSSDYMPFQGNGEVITGLFESNESSTPHTARDLLVNMDPAYTFQIAKAATAATLHFAQAYTGELNRTNFVEDPLQLAPNPSKDQLHINWDALKIQTGVCVISDALGRITSVQPVQEDDVIDVSKLTSGIYHLTLTNEYKSFKSTFIKN